jgi:outer membrane autotransporter protein
VSKSKHSSRLTVLSVALTAALAAMAPTDAKAQTQPLIISSDTTSSVNWTSDDLTVNSGVSVNVTASPGVNAAGTSLGTLTNNGSIKGNHRGIWNVSSTIPTLTNSGTITGGNNAIDNGGTIGTLTNSGTITSAGYAIYNSGAIGTLTNSGTITGANYAIYNTTNGSLATIANSGTIAGNIANLSSSVLSISGGTGTTFGTLTGYGGGSTIGTITNTLSNIAFASGNQLLNDNIAVGTHTVNNSGGTLQVNNRISITGNYSQSAAATLNIGVADNAITSTGTTGDSGYGRLTVSGTANIAAASTVALKQLNSFAFAQGQRYVVVVASNGGTVYNENSLNYSATGFNGTITGTSMVDGGNLDLLLTLNGASGSSTPINSATTSNSVSSLSGVFNYTGTNAALMYLSNAAAALGSTAAANRAGAQLSPAATSAAATQAVTAPTQAVLNVVGAHVDSLRVAQADGESGIAAGESSSDVAMWAQAFGGQARQDQRDNVSGYNADYNGVLIGADTLIGDHWRVGGLGSYANTSMANDGDNSGSSTHATSYGLIGYAGYAGQQWYADFSAGAVQHKYSTMRSIGFTGFSGDAAGQHNGMQYVASAQAGYPIKLNALTPDTTLTPLAGLTYSTLHQDAYTETGGNGAALSVDAMHSTSVKSELGAKLERSFATEYGALAPSVQLTWRHEYGKDALHTASSYAADTTGATTFTSLGPTPVADTGVLSLAATLTHSENASVTARYTVEAASGYLSQTADVRLRYRF